MATLEELLNGAQPPAALPNVNPQGLTQAGSNMATMGAQPSPVTNPQPQPPATPEEFNARKNGWMQMMQQLRADPSAQQAVMFTAARLLQGQKFGQSVGGALGEAAFGGMSMYNQLQQNQADQASQAQKDELERQRTQAQVSESQQRIQESQQRVKTEQFELGEAEKEAPIKAGERELKQKKTEFLMGLVKFAHAGTKVDPENLPPMERAWYYEAMKPEFAAELSQARAELARGQVDLATRRLELASQAMEFKKLQEETNKKQRTLLKQIKGDDGAIYNTYMNPDNTQTMERLVPGMPLADAKMQAQQEHDEEFGKPGVFGSRDEKWIAQRTAELRRGWVEKEENGVFVKQDAKAPAGTPAQGAGKKEITREALAQNVASKKQPAPTGGAEVEFTRTKPEAKAAPTGGYAVKKKVVNRATKYYVEGDPTPNNSYEFEADANERARVLRMRAQKGK